MTLALSRIRSGSAPLRGPLQRSAGGTLRQGLARRVKAIPLRFYPAAALSLILVGIAANALVFQRERHPAPLFGSRLPLNSAAAPERQPLLPPKPSAERGEPASEPPAALPPVRPDGADGSSTASSDQITDLLRGEGRAEGAHLVLAAQTALVKLGYPVKPDGNDGLATQQALRDFERAHDLPVSTEITPRLIKQLNAAARAGAR